MTTETEGRPVDGAWTLAQLLASGDRVLVEASTRDRIWGIGMGRNNPSAERPSEWRGKNLLGFALMQARVELRGQ